MVDSSASEDEYFGTTKFDPDQLDIQFPYPRKTFKSLTL